MKQLVLDYFSDLQKEYQTGRAGEHAYRHALKKLIQEMKKDRVPFMLVGDELIIEDKNELKANETLNKVKNNNKKDN